MPSPPTNLGYQEAGSASPSASLVVVWTTVANIDDGRRLAESLLEQRLAACVQIDAATTSFYVWEGVSEQAIEHRLVIKTTRAKSAVVLRFLDQAHPYDEPQIVVLPVSDASDGYRRWVVDAVDG